MHTYETKDSIFPRGDRAPADYFTGTAWVKSLVTAEDAFNTVIGNVVFEQRGCRQDRPG
jgi:quercetin dioxygenase-like cupin family protein